MQHEINLNQSCDKIGHENVIWTLEDIMWWYWENVDKNSSKHVAWIFVLIYTFSINKWIKVKHFAASAFLLQYLGRVWSAWSIQMGAGQSRLSQADPLMDIPCSGITETSVHHVIVEVFYIGQTSSVFCEKGRYYLSGHYVFKHTIPNCQSAIYRPD